MENWLYLFDFDPLPPLLSSGKQAIQYFAKRDLLGEEAGSINDLWQLPEA